MEKRFYLAVKKNATAQCSRSAPVAVVAENSGVVKVRLLENCVARDFLGYTPAKDLEIVARKGEEFDIPNNFEGESLREKIGGMEEDEAFPVPMKDHTGKNGYVGELSYRQPGASEPINPQLELLESLYGYKIKTA